MPGDEPDLSVPPSDAIGPAGRGRTVTIAISIVVVSLLVLVPAAVAVRAWRHTVIDPEGTVYNDVATYTMTIRCGLSGSSMRVQAIDAGDLTWYGDPFDRQLTPDMEYRGQLRIVKVADASLKTYRGTDQAEFTTGSDLRVAFHPWRPNCD